MDEEQRKAVDEAQYESMMAGYEAVLPRFATGRDRPRPRKEWCRAPIEIPGQVFRGQIRN
jgi:hypothetical protein